MRKKVVLLLSAIGSIGVFSFSLFDRLSTIDPLYVKAASDKGKTMDLVSNLQSKVLQEGKVEFVSDGYTFSFEGEGVAFDANGIHISKGGYLRNFNCFNNLKGIRYKTNGDFVFMSGTTSKNVISKYQSAVATKDSVALEATGGEHFMLFAKEKDVTLTELTLEFDCTYEGIMASESDKWDATWSWGLEGSGVKQEPFLISSLNDWNEFAEATKTYMFKDRYFKLTANIGDETNKVTTSADASHETPFSGHFDGDGHEVYIDISDDANRAGLFAHAGNNASFENVTIRGSVLGKESVAGSLVSALVSDATIRNVKNYASVSAKDTVGGIVGFIYGNATSKTILDNLENHGAISVTNNFLGGIVGKADGKQTISNSRNYADITYNGGDSFTKDTQTFIGGIVGYNETGSIDGCGNYGSMISKNKYALKIGGIVGRTGKGNVSNCVYGYTKEEINQGKTQPSFNVTSNFCGGIVGSVDGLKDAAAPTISNCVNYVNLSQTSKSCLGGIAGLSNFAGVNFISCSNYGNITGIMSVGGIAGRAVYTVTFTGCANNGIVKIGETEASQDVGQEKATEDAQKKIPGRIIGNTAKGTLTIN